MINLFVSSFCLCFRSVLTDLVSEARETKNVIDEAHQTIQNASELAAHHDHHVDHAVRKSDMFESNLFGYDSNPPAPAAQQAPAVQPAMSFDSMNGPASAAPPVEGGVSVAYQQSHQAPMVTTVSSDEEDAAGGAPAPDASAPSLFENEIAPPPAQPEISKQPEPTALPEPAPQPMPAPMPVQSAPPPAQSLGRPAPIHQNEHYKRESVGGFNSDFVMGGSAEPLPDPANENVMSPASRSVSDGSAYGYEDQESYQIVEDMKKKAEAASETARDAEGAYRKLANEANELRSDADRAEATARSLRAAADEKKKGTFGGGKKKKMQVGLLHTCVLYFHVRTF